MAHHIAEYVSPGHPDRLAYALDAFGLSHPLPAGELPPSDWFSIATSLAELDLLRRPASRASSTATSSPETRPLTRRSRKKS